MARKNDGSVVGVAIFLVVMAGMVLHQQSATIQRRLMTWTETPETAVGVMARAAYPRLAVHSARFQQLCMYTAMNIFISLANQLRPFVPWFVLLSTLGGVLPLLTRRFGPARYWKFESLIAAAMITGTGGCGLGLAMPAAWPWPLFWLPGGILAAFNAATGIWFMALAAQVYRGPLRLQYGPSFRPPAVQAAPAINLGRVDSDILPRHARWLAVSGGDIKIPYDQLSCGITVLGEKGAGKSRLLFAIHDAIRGKYPKVPILIHDPKCEWYRTYYDPRTDLFFAPHYKGTVAWAMWRDFNRVPELRKELLTTCVQAHQDHDDTFWMDQALVLLDEASGCGTFDEAVAHMSKIPKQHPHDKFQLSVFGTAKLGFLDLAKVEGMSAIADAPARSIDDFLRPEGQRIILYNNPACASEQKGGINMFLTAFLLRALSLPDVPLGTLRAVAIIDEALTFNLPPKLEETIHKLCRSKGVCIVAGAQRLPDPQLDERGAWRNAEYTVAMKCIDQSTQRDLSKRAGTLLFRRATQSTTTPSSGEAGPSCTKGEQDVSQEAIPPEHFGRLAPRQFALFHNQGIVTGKTVNVAREQREIPLPKYDERVDVRRLSTALTACSAEKTKEPGGVAPDQPGKQQKQKEGTENERD